MATNPELRRAFILFVMSILDSRYVYGYLGRLESDGTVTFPVTGRPGYTYVTIWRGGKINIDKCVNGGANPNPNLLVQMERVHGVLTVLRPDPASAAQVFQEFAGMAFVPPHVATIGSGIDDSVEGRRFVPGLLAPSSAGGLNVRVFPFFTRYGYVTGDESFTIDDPSTAGTRAWVVVYADDSNVLQYSVSATHHPGTSGELAESLIPSEITLPDNATPVGAVVVANAGTVTANSQFADYRFHFDTAGGVDFDPDSILSDSNGDVLTDSNGNVLLGG